MSTRLAIVYLYPEGSFGGDSSRQTGLSRALSAYNDVVFVELAGPTRGFGVSRLRMRREGPRLLVAENVFGYRCNRLMRRMPKLQRTMDARAFTRLLRRHGIDDYVLWLSVAAPEFLELVRTDRVVYDCIDPCFLPDRQRAFDAAEHNVVSRSQLVFATARTLLERMQGMHEHVVLLNNAADTASGSDELKPPVPEPLLGRPHPVVGYLGTVDWRVDSASLFAAATALPDYTFCIAGRVNVDQIENTRSLRRLPNVVMPGSVPVEEGPAYTAAFDVGVIPYLPGEIGDSINPVKMYMYLSMGMPVVSTWLRESRESGAMVEATHDTVAFVAAIRRAVSNDGPGRRSERLAFAARNTWDARARTAIAALEERALLTRGGNISGRNDETGPN